MALASPLKEYKKILCNLKRVNSTSLKEILSVNILREEMKDNYKKIRSLIF